MSAIKEYEEATHLYRRSLARADSRFHLTPPLPSATLSHCDDETWYLRHYDSCLIARVSKLGVRLP